MADDQPDMFSRLALAPVAPEPGRVAAVAPTCREFIPAPPTVEWAKALARSETGHETIVFVSHLWTGVVREMLCDPGRGRLLLERDGRIREIVPDAAARGRVIYMDARQVLALHNRRPLLPIDNGGSSARRYRFASPGEDVPALLPLPPKVDDCE